MKIKLSIICSLALCIAQANTVKPRIGFIENKGQISSAKSGASALFSVAGVGAGIYVTDKGLTYILRTQTTARDVENGLPAVYNWSKIEMTLENAVIKTENIVMEKAVPGVSHFYYAHCPDGILNVKTWQKITIKNIYPGIDWILTADEKQGLAYDFLVHPGADPSAIVLAYHGAQKISSLDNKRKIKLSCANGEIYEGKLEVMQNGKEIGSSFKLKGNKVRFGLNEFDHSQDLMIDPPLQWSQKEISSGIDYGTSLVVPRDGTGDVLVAGFAGSLNFPTTGGAYQGSNAGNDDMVILRLNANGTVLWATYYGGGGDDGAKGIGADVAGNCYVSGYTNSTNFPVQNALYSLYQGGTYDIGIVKLSNTGVRQWATYYGNQQTDYANAMVCDQGGNCYITGYTNSPSFPVLNAAQGIKNIVYDAFVLKLNSSAVVQWATFLGGDDEDRGRGITLDATGANVFVTGTAMGQFPVTTGVFQQGSASPYAAEDAFLTKYNASTGAIVYATLCGGTDVDIAEDVAVDNAGNAYMVGYTFSNDYWIFNPGGGAYVDSTQNSPATHDVFITKFNATGTAVPWSTYMGGSSVDMAFGICYDPFYGMYVVGESSSTDFPTQVPPDAVFYQGTQGDGGTFYDFFVAWFTTAGVLKWSTFYGDANSNEGRAVDTDAQSNIFVCGTDSNNVRVMKFNAPQTTGVSSQVINTDVKLYPVPASNEINLTFASEKTGAVKIEIVNLTGEIVRTESVQIVNGTNTIRLDISTLAAGNYLLKWNGSSSGSKKFERL